jgi:hypothetical protein
MAVQAPPIPIRMPNFPFLVSKGAMAQALTERGHEPPRGGAWSYQTVLRMMERLGLKG